MKGGIDQGFCLSYWRLSYRRKFLRTVWTIALAPILIAPLAFADWEPHYLLFWAVVLAAVSGAQLHYTYRKWQQERAVIGG